MKRLTLLCMLLALAPAAVLAQSYSAVLTGAAEVPGPGDADGSGLAVITLDGATLRYTVWIQNIATPTQAHIHSGAAGITGDAVVTLDAASLGSGSVTLTAEVADRIRANPSGYYVNVHNADFPNGALRGQLTGTHSGGGVTTAYVPVVGKVQGANNTNFVTDLRIINQGAATATVTLDYFASSAAGHPAPTVSRQISILPGEQDVLNDVVGSSLGVASGLGGLRITSDQGIVASARVINDLRASGTGTAGFAIAAQESGATSGTIGFLASNIDFRTNIGYFNPGASAVTATFSARRSADGAVLGTGTLTIPGYAMVQQGAFDLISSVAASERTQDDFYVSWSSSGPLFVYGAVTDNRTGDAVLNR